MIFIISPRNWGLGVSTVPHYESYIEGTAEIGSEAWQPDCMQCFRNWSDNCQTLSDNYQTLSDNYQTPYTFPYKMCKFLSDNFYFCQMWETFHEYYVCCESGTIPWVGVTKALLFNFSIIKIFDLANAPARFFVSHSYSTSVTTAKLRRHLSNMNVIFSN